ncbi:MAG TPA: T9SS type A sorting domain-containing protein, partial [Candidatus Kapabacteria bacterium]
KNGSDACLSSHIVPDSAALFMFNTACGDTLLSEAVLGTFAVEGIYPNPTSGVVHIGLFVPTTYGNDSYIEVYNELGEKLQQQPIAFASGVSGIQQTDIDLSGNRGAGIRYLRIVTPNGIITKSVLFLPELLER